MANGAMASHAGEFVALLRMGALYGENYFLVALAACLFSDVPVALRDLQRVRVSP